MPTKIKIQDAGNGMFIKLPRKTGTWTVQQRIES